MIPGNCLISLEARRAGDGGLFTVSRSEEALVAASGLVGQVLADVHVCVHLVPYLFKCCVQVGLPQLLIQAVDELGQLDLQGFRSVQSV